MEIKLHQTASFFKEPIVPMEKMVLPFLTGLFRQQLDCWQAVFHANS
jgi:hypothetical protein